MTKMAFKSLFRVVGVPKAQEHIEQISQSAIILFSHRWLLLEL